MGEGNVVGVRGRTERNGEVVKGKEGVRGERRRERKGDEGKVRGKEGKMRGMKGR